MSAAVLQFPIPAQSTTESPTRPTSRKIQRDYLTGSEVDRMVKAAKLGRWGTRDATLILLSYRHGLRSIEAANLQWSAVSFDEARLHVWRAKRGFSTVHPLSGQELRLLRQLRREFPGSAFLFMSERGNPLSTRAIRSMVATVGDRAGLDFRAHPHQLRHGCGHALAEAGTDTRTIQDYLGHRKIEHTVRYTQGTAARFKNLWKN